MQIKKHKLNESDRLHVERLIIEWQRLKDQPAKNKAKEISTWAIQKFPNEFSFRGVVFRCTKCGAMNWFFPHVLHWLKAHSPAGIRYVLTNQLTEDIW